MILISRFIFCTFLLTAVNNVYAQNEICPGSGIEVTTCLNNEQLNTDKELSLSYNEWFKYIDELNLVQDSEPPANFDPEEWKNEIRETHKKWKEYVKSECQLLFYEWWGGSGSAVGNAIARCELNFALDRVKLIKSKHPK